MIEDVVKSLSRDSSPTVVLANTGTWNNVRYVTSSVHIVGYGYIQIISQKCRNKNTEEQKEDKTANYTDSATLQAR